MAPPIRKKSATASPQGPASHSPSSIVLFLYALALAAILGGALKLLTHFYSRWRLQPNPLDYCLGACGVAGGLMIIYSPKIRSYASLVVIAVAATKGATDFRDPWDLILSAIIFSTGLLAFMKIGLKRPPLRRSTNGTKMKDQPDVMP